MFNPQALTKDSPLAHVWLASSMDRKLSKNNYIRTNIVAVVDEIKGEQGHTAGGSSLRLSGQLLFGVSTIYQRKTLYLKEDCDSALQSLKTFKPGNVDTVSGSTNNTAKESTLVLQNQITDLNINNLMPDFPSLDFGDGDIPMTQIAVDDEDNDAAPEAEMSIAADDSVEIGRGTRRDADEDVAGDEDDLGLDFGEEEEEHEEDHDKSVEVGLERPPARADADDLALDEDVLPKDFNTGEGDENAQGFDHDAGGPDFDIDMDFGDDGGAPPGQLATTPEPEPEAEGQELAGGPEDEPQQQEPPKKQRKRAPATRRAKVAQIDTQSLESDQRQSQEQLTDESAYEPPLPVDKTVFRLYQLHQQPEVATLAYYKPAGGFSNIVADIFTPENISRVLNAQAEEDDNERTAKHARTEEALEEGDHELEKGGDAQEQGQQVNYDAGGPDFDMDMDFGDNGGYEQQPEEEQEEPPRGDEELQQEFHELRSEEPVLFADDENEELGGAAANGISKNTLQAARILRKEMPDEGTSTSFDVVSTSSNRPDTVKMFFEMLVLATKDAISVDQPEAFGDVTINAKEGLFGARLMV